MKKLILIILILGGINFSVKSSHAVGGEIHFAQTGPNSYNVTMRLFRYCSGAGLGSTSQPSESFTKSVKKCLYPFVYKANVF